MSRTGFPISLRRFSTMEVCICWRISCGPLLDFVGFSMTSQSCFSEGPASDIGLAAVEASEATEAPPGEGADADAEAELRRRGGEAAGVALAAALGLAIFLAEGRGGILNPTTFHAFFSSSLSSGMPQNRSARCFNVSKGTSATYKGSNWFSKNSPKFGVNSGSRAVASAACAEPWGKASSEVVAMAAPTKGTTSSDWLSVAVAMRASTCPCSMAFRSFRLPQLRSQRLRQGLVPF